MAHILLVDDDADQLRMRQMILEKRGHQVRCADRMAGALTAAEEAMPECVVMDLRLPSAEEGNSLLRQLKSRWPELPVLVLTGWPQDLEVADAAKSPAEVLRKPVRSERLLSAIARFAASALMMMCTVAAQEAARSFEFDVRSAESELVAEVAAEATANWASPGSEAALAQIKVDGLPAHHLWVFGENRKPAAVFLGRLAAGRHTVTVSRDRRSAPGAMLRINNVRVREVPASSPLNAVFAQAPVLFARANTLGRFSDVPLLMYATESRDEGLRLLEYSVIFSNEDGGTSSRNLMARWGRVTDIEYVYRVWLDEKGGVARTLIQTRNHKDVAYEGARFGAHPLLQPVTDNNMVEPAADGASPLRFQLAPSLTDLSQGSRELVMDEEPWTYVVARKELQREKKLRATAMRHNDEHISDPANYLVVEIETSLKDSAFQVLVQAAGQKRFYGSASGRAPGYVERSGWARVAIELPPGQAERGIEALGVECMVLLDPKKKDNPATGSCEVLRFGKVFFAKPDGSPGDAIRVEGGAQLQAGEVGLFAAGR